MYEKGFFGSLAIAVVNSAMAVSRSPLLSAANPLSCAEGVGGVGANLPLRISSGSGANLGSSNGTGNGRGAPDFAATPSDPGIHGNASTQRCQSASSSRRFDSLALKVPNMLHATSAP